MLPLRQRRWLAAAGVLLAGMSLASRAEESRLAKTALREEIRFAPPGPDEVAPPLPEDEEAIEMAPVTVTESMLRRDLERTVHTDRSRREEQAFSWKTGGRLTTRQIGHVQADVGVWPTLVERRETAIKGPDVMLSIDLLRLKW